MEPLQPLNTNLIMVMNKGNLSFGKDKSRDSTQEDRGPIQPLNSEGCSRVSIVPSSKSSRKHRQNTKCKISNVAKISNVDKISIAIIPVVDKMINADKIQIEEKYQL